MELTFNNNRIQSIDILRGITILVMIFVNDVSGIKELPWWTYHIPRGEQGITYVDVVFPAFLMIMGMSIPLAIRNRLSKGDSTWKIILHIIIRGLSLVAIGILIMNGRKTDPEATGMSYAWWNSLMFLGVILFWNSYPKTVGNRKVLFTILKWSGLALLILLLFIYRRNDEGEIKWIDPGNSAILGSLGFAYISCGILYLLFRNNIRKHVIALTLLIALNVGMKAGVLDFVREWPSLLWPFRSGSAASIVLTGVMLSLIFFEGVLGTQLKEKIRFGVVFVAAQFILGWVMLPFGLAKIGGTPSWCLFSTGFTGILFILIYWIVDVKKKSGWAGFISPAGSNPLLVYLLPDVYYAIFRDFHRNVAMEGPVGIIRSVLLTALILAVATVLTRRGVRLQV